MKKIIIKSNSLENAISKLKDKTGKEDYIIRQKGKSYLFGLIKKPYIIESKKEVSIDSESYNFRINEALKIAEDFDGFFTIDYKDKSAYLTVYPSGKSGQDVNYEEIIQRLNLLKAENFNENLIRKAVEEKNKVAVKIADWPHGETLNSFFKINVESDKMKSYITIYPPKKGGNFLKSEDIISGLKKQNIVYGINKIEIEKAIKKNIFNKPILAAEGLAPKDGDDAYIKYMFSTEPKIKLKEDKYGRVDFKEINLIQSVKENEILCKKINLTEGVSGYNIFNKELKAKPGQDINFKLGKNVELSSDKTEVYSTINGQPRINVNTNEILVDEICNIEGNVDYSTGNINFDGSVIINGRVEDNFKVIATGDIVIHGNVGKSFVQSDASVVVEAGIIGKTEAVVKAKKNIMARFVENANLYAGDSIIVDKMIMHSKIIAKNKIQVLGEKGALIGGLSRSSNGVTVNELGAIGGTITLVETGLNTEIIDELAILTEKIIEAEKIVNKIDLAVQTLEKNKSNLSNEEKLQYKKLSAMLEKAHNKLKQLQFNEQQLKRNCEINKRAFIRVQNTLFPGVKVIFGRLQRQFSKDEIHVRLGLLDNKITIYPYD